MTEAPGGKPGASSRAQEQDAFDWQTVNDFTVWVPVALDVGENGEPWVPMPDAQPQHVVEDDADFEL